MPVFSIFYTVGALMDAARKGNLDKVKRCITKGIDAEAKDKDELTALHFASQNGHLNVVQYLMEECYIKESKTKDGLTVLHSASSWGRMTIVQYLIETCHFDKEAKDNRGRTALYYASESCKLDIVQYLIKSCQVDKEAKDNIGWTALHIASINGHLELVQCLIKTCHVDKDSKTKSGMTALHFASSWGRLMIVQYLIETCHVDKEAKDYCGRTALHYASESDRLDIVQYLIESCHCDKEAKTSNERTALHLASSWGAFNIVQYLAETCYLDMEAKDSDGQTAYDIARAYNKGSVVRYFKRRRAASATSTLKVNYMESAKDNTTADQLTSNMPNRKTVERLQQEKEFLVAARSGDLDKVKKFVAKGIDTEAKGEDGGTALHAASTWGHLNTVQYLIETCHVHAEAKTNAGRTAFHNACESGKLNIVQFLMKKRQVHKEAKDETGWTPLHCASANGHLNIVQFAIEKCHVDKESKTNGGWTPLHFACWNGHCKVVQYLIEECHVIAEATDNDGQTAYDIARRQNQRSVLKYLEKARADSTTTKINCIDSAKGNTVADQSTANPTNLKTAKQLQLEKDFLNAAEKGFFDQVQNCIKNGVDKEAKDEYGRTALHFASWSGHLNIVQYLIENIHVDKEAPTNEGDNPLNLASGHGQLKIVQYLIEICNVDKNAKDKNGWTAFLRASSNGQLKIVQYLIETCHVDTEARVGTGWTALHWASYNGNLEIVQYLIEVSHVDKEVKTNRGFTALHCASMQHGRLDVVQYLIEKCHVNMDSKDGYGETSFDMARKNNQSSVVHYLEKARADSITMRVNNMESAKTSLTSHDNIVTDPQSTSNTNNTNTNEEVQREKEFLDAAENGDLDKVKVYIDNGVHKEAKEVIYGQTALHFASKSGHLNIVKYLVETCHVDAEVKTNNGRTALHLASAWGRFDVVQYFIETCRIDKKEKDDDGETAYDLARKNNSSTVVQYLEEKEGDSSTMKVNNRESGQTLSTINDSILGTKTFNANSDHCDASRIKNDLNEEWISELMASLQGEMQSFVYELSHLGNSHQCVNERREILDLLVVEKCNAIDEQAEQNAILASPLHRDFYLLLQRKLKCMIKSCETMSTGMVGVSGGDMRSFAARTIREKGCNVLRETKLGYFIGSAVQWTQQNLAVVPFIDTVGSVFQLIVTLSEERDRYLSLARVADFAAMVCLQQYGTTSLDNAVEKFARLIVRARCGSPPCKFVEEMDEFGKYKQLMINLLADSGDTPAKEQASKAADCAFAHIMKPGRNSLLSHVLYGDTVDVSLHEALAASILGISLDDLRELESCTIALYDGIPSKADTDDKLRIVTRKMSNMGMNGTSLQADSFASSDMVAEQDAKLQKQDEMIQKLSHQVAHLEKKAKQSDSCTNYDAGDGLVYANPAEQFKNEISSLQTENVVLDQRQSDQATIIDNLMSRVVDLEKQQLGIDTQRDTKKATYQNE